MRTLLLAPHHDDETLFASFICLTYSPKVVICYGHSEINGVPSDVRDAEVRRALSHLTPDSMGLRIWPLSDVSTSVADLEVRMDGLRRRADWNLVFAPAEEVRGHPQHNIVARLADSIFGTDCTVEHYMTYTTPPLERSRSKREVPYDPSWLFRKHAALACHRSAADTPSYRHFAEDMKEYLA